MTNAELEFMSGVKSILKDIRDQLKVANQLKAFELKLNHFDQANLIEEIAEGYN